MARGLTVWARFYETDQSWGSTPTVYTHNKEETRPHEVEQISAWAREVALQNTLPKELRDNARIRPTKKKPIQCALTVGQHTGGGMLYRIEIERWQLCKGIRLLGGNWLAWHEEMMIGILIPTNTTNEKIEEMIDDCVRALAAIEEWEVLE